MESLITTILLSLLALFYFLSKLGSCSHAMKFDLTDEVSRTFKVDMKGHGDFRTVQEAIDSIPSNNSWWTRIILNHGLYFEKVVIPQEKPYIILEGHPKFLTAIEFGDFGSVGKSPTFTLLADNFVARNILFKNSYDHLIKEDPNRRTTWAVAAKIVGDKASFYHCGFISLQDTLWDARGRHYFYDCDVRGAIDFIWGNGQSIYEKCQIMSLSKIIGTTGYITAQGREGPDETTGFVFKDCYVCGSGTAFLGRAYRNYSRVLFSGTYMENVITPEGWSLWTPPQISYADVITFSEANCRGPGADLSRRISWEKKLSDEEVISLTNTASFIDQDGWLGKQPRALSRPL
uniref:probable pectinesterase 29 n=1 Tax=Fragaria vesca subsp. vesca TaxID=101020 RepID=UPI0005C86BFA|nr:PREDICTED: probable pectinesterase 29 [Fragaria vesca subsp. vesca]